VADVATHQQQIQSAIEEALRRGAAQWPELVVSAPVFAQAMARSLAEAPDPAAALLELHVTDLYLAQACADGAPAAIAAFEDLCRKTIEGSLRAIGLADHVIADVAQDVRSKMFVAADGAPGKIATYSGRSTLRNWVRTIAIRCAASLMRRGTDDALDDEVMESLPTSPADGPDEQHFRATYHAELKDAFEAAMASLTPQQRNLLRHRFVDGLGVEAIGALYGVHKTTASRWLEDARTLLAKRTKNGFVQRTRVTPSEMRSIVRILESNVELSLRRVLS
jgi:RNA polymerase sigma-70 factor, ECF subfamily